MNMICGTCEHYKEGVPEELRQKWQATATGQWAKGVCRHTFPKTYSGKREPPHAASPAGWCFEWSEKKEEED